MALSLDLTPLPRLRGAGLEWAANTSGVSDAMLDEVLDYFDRINVRDVVRKKIADRFAVRIARTETTTGAIVEKIERGSVRDSIENGLYEVIQLGLLDRVVRTTATLHTENERYQYVMEDGETEADDVAEFISQLRERGSARRAMIRTDRLSVGLGSAVLHLRYMGHGISYEPIPPQAVKIGFPSYVVEGDQKRPADTNDLNDASIVVIRLSGSGRKAPKYDNAEQAAKEAPTSINQQDSSFLAYCGASEQYPVGRLVQYTAHDWNRLPNVGQIGAIDWTASDGWVEGATLEQLANPLTLAQQEMGDYSIPEYPIAVYLGGDARYYRELLPRTGYDLYESSVEMDVAASQLAMDALTAARGIYALKNPQGSPRLIDTWDRGLIELTLGQDLAVLGTGGGNVESGWRVIQEQMRTIAEEYDIPGWMVTADSSGAPESGYSVALQTEPLKRAREERAHINATAVERVYQIERGLLTAHSGVEIDPGVRQLWNPGSYKTPVNPTEQVTTLQAALTAGLVDMVGAVQEYHGLDSREDARAYLEQRKEDEGLYPVKSATPAPQQGGLAGLLAARRTPPGGQ